MTKMGYMINLTLAHQVFAVNEQELNKLPADLRKLLLDKASNGREVPPGADRGGPERAQDAGREGRHAARSAAGRDGEVRAVTRPMWKEWTDKNGPIAEKMLNTALESCR